MSSAALARHTELLDELRTLADRLPVPHPSWHPYAGAIAASRDDLRAAVDEAAGSEAALDLLAALFDGASEPPFAAGASPQLDAAWERLQTLPPPDGQHPFLDEILPMLEALRLVLVALSRAEPSG